MTSRKRDVWLLIAGLPGVAAPFVPVTKFISDLTLVKLVPLRDENTMMALPVFVPLFVVAWQLHRVVTGRENVAWRAVAWVVAAVATVAAVLSDLLWYLSYIYSLGQAFIFLGPIAANGGLLLYASRRGRSPNVIAETFLLGTYVATTAPWALDLIFKQSDRTGTWLIAWTCLAYLATIVTRLRASPAEH